MITNKIEIYTCEYCKKQSKVKELIEQCEENHTKKEELILTKLDYTTNCKHPTLIRFQIKGKRGIITYEITNNREDTSDNNESDDIQNILEDIHNLCLSSENNHIKIHKLCHQSGLMDHSKDDLDLLGDETSHY